MDQISVGFKWQTGGSLSLSSTSRLSFSERPRRPAVYRFAWTTAGPVLWEYIGECGDMRLCFGSQYPHPQGRGVARSRMASWLRGALSDRLTVSINLVTDAVADVGQGWFSLDLADPSARHLMEAAAQVASNANIKLWTKEGNAPRS
jgi:hypothetical protein